VVFDDLFTDSESNACVLIAMAGMHPLKQLKDLIGICLFKSQAIVSEYDSIILIGLFEA
jgi:hypothetical protein